jgi:hypothetical protein
MVLVSFPVSPYVISALPENSKVLPKLKIAQSWKDSISTFAGTGIESAEKPTTLKDALPFSTLIPVMAYFTSV